MISRFCRASFYFHKDMVHLLKMYLKETNTKPAVALTVGFIGVKVRRNAGTEHYECFIFE